MPTRDPERVRAKNRRHYLKFRDRYLKRTSQQMAQRFDDPKFRERWRTWKATWRQKRREEELANAGDATPSLLKAMLDMAVVCVYCGVTLTKETRTLDHVVAVSRGGLHDSSNLVAACRRCNASKRDRSAPFEGVLSGATR